MNNNDNFFNNTESMSQYGSAGDHVPGYSAGILPEDKDRTPGNMREDASKWDQLSDGQRKLIVFGVLAAIVAALALVLWLGSSCGSCTLCASPSDAPDRVVSDSVPAPGDGDSSNFHQVEEDGSVDDSHAPDDDNSSIIVTSTDVVVNEDDRQTASSDPFSACNHQADNEAGSGTAAGNASFLSFLFGCTGCADSCTISCADGLTDPIGDGEDDPDRNDMSFVSGSDADQDIWPAQPDDEAYLEMMSGNLADISDLIIQLSELDVPLSQFNDPDSVSDNERFRSVCYSILLWCQGAEEYDTSLLSDERAVECGRVSVHLAANLRTYIEDYPYFITGAVSGTDAVDKNEQLNVIMADIVAMYTAINSAPVQPEVTEE